MPKIADVLSHSEFLHHLNCSLTDLVRIRIQQMRIQISLQRLAWTAPPCLSWRRRPADTDYIELTVFKEADLAIFRENGQKRSRSPLFHLCRDVLQVGHAELFVNPGWDLTTVRVKNRQQRGSRVELADQILDDQVAQCPQQPPGRLGIKVEPFLGAVEATDCTTFNHVAHQRPWGAGKANHGDFVLNLIARPINSVEDIAQCFLYARAQIQLFHVLRCFQSKIKLGPNLWLHATVHSHGNRNHQDIRKNDQRVQAWIPSERLKRDLAGESGRFADREEIGVAQHGQIFRKVPASLPHHPFGRAVDSFSAGGPQ
mmetsp:Transcript_41299/g.76853  ORF Transcript_41299/g.76853 Transcript_41299/m.76853 type:complete len:314 (+) Transcript_41299:374-1315(+)